MALVFNIFLGLTLSTTTYTKSLNFEYESLRVESYGMDLSLDISNDFFLELDTKRLGAQVQSGTGKLNIYGWDYTHDISMLKFGFDLDKKNSIYISPILYYMPLLFPVQVGALTSIAAFEKTLAHGVGLGYKTERKFKKYDVKFDASLSYLDFASSEYNSKYNYLLDIDVNPTYALGESMSVGLNYNLVHGLVSLTENKTGSAFPFKTSYFLHNLFFTFAYTLQ